MSLAWFQRAASARRVSVLSWACAIAGAAVLGLSGDAAAGGPADPWADEVVAHVPGVGGAAGFGLPASTLGEPSRFTGEGLFPSVVSPFSPPFLPDELLSLGLGGSVVLRFDEPIVDDPANPFGIDFIVFGNTGYIDARFPSGVVGGIFSDDGGLVEVSADGVFWTPLVGAADGAFPTLGYLDAGPYDDTPGAKPSDFQRPVDPSLAEASLDGLDLPSLVALYDGSGGGAGFDLAGSGLASVAFVRISVAPGAFASVEIDAVADVRPAAPAADLNGDGVVDGADLGLLLAAWASAGPGDLDGDGVVDGADLGLLLAAFGDAGTP